MAVDADSIENTIKHLNSMKESMGSLSELMQGTQTVSDGLLNSFKEFATAGSSSSLWNAVSRFSSGIFPGFWSIQNKFRAVAVYMQYVEKKQKEQIKVETNIAEKIDNQSKVRLEAFKTLETLNDEALLASEKITLTQDKYLKYLIKTKGEHEALNLYKEKFKVHIKDNIKSELVLAQHVTKRIRNEEKHQKLFDATSASKIKALSEILYFTEQEEAIKLTMADLDAELYDFYNAKAAGGGKFMNEKGDFIEGTDELRERKKVIDELKSVQDKELQSVIMSRKVHEKSTGVKIEGGTDVVESEGEDDENPLLKIFKDFKEKWGKRITMTKAFFSKTNLRMIAGAAGKALLVFGQVLLFVAALGLLIFILRKLGVFEKLVDFFKWFKDSGFFKDIMSAFMIYLEGIWDIVSGIFTLIYGLFSGDSSLVMNSIAKIGEGLIKVLVSMIFMSLNILFGGLLGAIGIDIESVIDTIIGVYTGIVSLIGTIFGFLGPIVGSVMGAAAGSVFGPVGTIAGGVAGYALGESPIKYASDNLTGKASGGRVLGGTYLVGESGPEIISLPGSAHITPAQQSRNSMGNTINVHVNGRLGASDGELDDIARRIGQKINREMNKYGSSGYRA